MFEEYTGICIAKPSFDQKASWSISQLKRIFNFQLACFETQASGEDDCDFCRYGGGEGTFRKLFSTLRVMA